jgi:Fur family peroxide stress response transcriptional regulator
MRRLDHPTAMDVYLSARCIDPHISLGTVYRNLNNLVLLGEIKKITMPDKTDRFDATISEHHHVFCTHCRQVFDVDVNVKIGRAHV